MVDRQVIINDYQEVPASDFMAMQSYAQAGVDDLVKYAIHDGQAYAGFALTISGTFEVTIAPGLYVNAGKMHASRQAATRDLVEFQPDRPTARPSPSWCGAPPPTSRPSTATMS